MTYQCGRCACTFQEQNADEVAGVCTDAECPAKNEIKYADPVEEKKPEPTPMENLELRVSALEEFVRSLKNCKEDFSVLKRF